MMVEPRKRTQINYNNVESGAMSGAMMSDESSSEDENEGRMSRTRDQKIKDKRRSRSSLPQRGSTPSGSEVPSWLPSPPSRRCGSPSRSTTSAAPPLSTASASKLITTSMEEKQHTGTFRHHL